MADIDLYRLNDLLCVDPVGAVQMAEDEYHSRVDRISDYVTEHRGVKVILIAGPSGSGKTTSANLIKDAITAKGRPTIVVSLDLFFYRRTFRRKHRFPRRIAAFLPVPTGDPGQGYGNKYHYPPYNAPW